jgi:hypothetical protein
MVCYAIAYISIGLRLFLGASSLLLILHFLSLNFLKRKKRKKKKVDLQVKVKKKQVFSNKILPGLLIPCASGEKNMNLI